MLHDYAYKPVQWKKVGMQKPFNKPVCFETLIWKIIRFKKILSNLISFKSRNIIAVRFCPKGLNKNYRKHENLLKLSISTGQKIVQAIDNGKIKIQTTLLRKPSGIPLDLGSNDSV